MVPGIGAGDRRLGAAVDDAGRQMPEQVDDARLGDAGRKPSALRNSTISRGPMPVRLSAEANSGLKMSGRMG